MKHTLLYIIGAVALMLAACSKEDDIVVKVDDTRYYFEPQPERTDEEAVLRRAFYDRYDIHLLFNDTTLSSQTQHSLLCSDMLTISTCLVRAAMRHLAR